MTERALAAKWDFRVWGLVDNPVRLTWDEFGKLPRTEAQSDFHCVTRWSRFDNKWTGVAFREVLKRVQPKPVATHVLVHAEQGFTANVPLADLQWLALVIDGYLAWAPPGIGAAT